MDNPSEFFKALYWHFEGETERLTTYNERALPFAELTRIAFERARAMNCNPLYMRVFSGEFLRHGDDNELSTFGDTVTHV